MGLKNGHQRRTWLEQEHALFIVQDFLREELQWGGNELYRERFRKLMDVVDNALGNPSIADREKCMQKWRELNR